MPQRQGRRGLMLAAGGDSVTAALPLTTATMPAANNAGSRGNNAKIASDGEALALRSACGLNAPDVLRLLTCSPKNQP